MSDVEEVGFLEEKKCEEAEIEWEIQNFFSVAENKSVIYSRIFTFANTQWRLQLLLKPKSLRRMRSNSSKSIKASYMRLYLRRIEICEEICSVECNLGIKKVDGSLDPLYKYKRILFLNGNETRTAPSYISVARIAQHRSQMAPSDTLVITCKLKSKDMLSDQPRILDALKLNTIIKTDLLSQNLKDLFTNKENCDTVLLVKGKEFEAHKAILIARSPVFAAMFRHDTAEKQAGKVCINDCDPDSFQVFLEYLYSGKLDGISSSSALSLYKISDKYNVQELKIFCVNYLKLSLTIQNVCYVLAFADACNEKVLLSTAQKFFNDNFKETLNTTGWELLVKNNFTLSKKILIQKENDNEQFLDIHVSTMHEKIRS